MPAFMICAYTRITYLGIMIKQLALLTHLTTT